MDITIIIQSIIALSIIGFSIYHFFKISPLILFIGGMIFSAGIMIMAGFADSPNLYNDGQILQNAGIIFFIVCFLGTLFLLGKRIKDNLVHKKN